MKAYFKKIKTSDLILGIIFFVLVFASLTIYGYTQNRQNTELKNSETKQLVQLSRQVQSELQKIKSVSFVGVYNSSSYSSLFTDDTVSYQTIKEVSKSLESFRTLNEYIVSLYVIDGQSEQAYYYNGSLYRYTDFEDSVISSLLLNYQLHSAEMRWLYYYSSDQKALASYFLPILSEDESKDDLFLTINIDISSILQDTLKYYEGEFSVYATDSSQIFCTSDAFIDFKQNSEKVVKMNGVRYLPFHYKDPETGYTYTHFLSANSAEILPPFGFAAMAIILFALLLFLLIRIFINKFSKESSYLIDIISSLNSKDLTAEDIPKFKYLNQIALPLKSKWEEIREEQKKNEYINQKELFRNCMISKNSYTQFFAVYGSYLFAIISVNFPDSEHIVSDIDCEAFFADLSEQDPEQDMEFTIIAAKRNTVSIVLSTQNRAAISSAYITKLANKFYKYLISKNYSMVHFGISNIFCGLSGMNDAYNESLLALQEYFYHDREDNIIFYDASIHSFVQNIDFFFKDAESDLITAIADRNIKASQDVISKLFDYIRQMHFQPQVISFFLNALAERIAYKVPDDFKGIDNTKIIEKNIPLLQELSETTNLNEYRNIITQLSNQTQKMLSDALPFKHSNIIHEIKQCISQNLSSPLSLEQIADSYNITPQYLSNIFLQETGENFRQYLTNERIKVAKSLLLQTKTSIDDISSLVGYTNKRSFYNAFKKNVGMTPTEYRNK